MIETTDARTFTITPGGTPVAAMQETLHYSQAVRYRTGTSEAPLDRVELSGQGGWSDDLAFPDDLGEEIVRAFDNVELILREAGASWSDVIAVDSFHVPTSPDSIDESHTGPVVAQLQARMPDHRPIWTQVGVAALGAVGMRVEIRVTALVPVATDRQA